MNNRAVPEFWRLYYQLPSEAQAQAKRLYEVFRENPNHPSLHFKPLKGRTALYSVRVGLHHRAVALRDGDTLRWFWIGTHSDFDKEF